MSKTITVKNTTELFSLLAQINAAGNIPVIQTDVRDLAISALAIAGAQYNSKGTLLDGIKIMKLSLSMRDDFIVPVFSHKHPVGMLPEPFVKLIVQQVNCRVDGLAQELLK